jgi:hypothetical protein
MYAVTVHNGRSQRSQGYGKPETELAAISFAQVTHQLTTPPLLREYKFFLIPSKATRHFFLAVLGHE